MCELLLLLLLLLLEWWVTLFQSMASSVPKLSGFSYCNALSIKCDGDLNGLSINQPPIKARCLLGGAAAPTHTHSNNKPNK